MGVLEQIQEDNRRLREFCTDLKKQMDELSKSASTLTEWLSMEDARQLYIAHGKAVSKSTFHTYVQGWIGNGTLIQNVHFRTAGTKMFIAKECFMVPKNTGHLTFSKTG